MILHHNIEIPKLSAKMVNGIRVYETPEGLLYPSITTILSILSEETIQNWQKRIGKKAAQKISNVAAARGTSLHQTIEKYLKNEAFTETFDFRVIKPHLSKITEIYCQEQSLWSDKYQIAGTVDCICIYDGKPTIIDFKTNKKKKKRDWLESYFIQGTFYAEAFEERTGIEVNNIVILILLKEDMNVDFIEVDRCEYLDLLITVRDMYRSIYEY